MGIRLLHVGIFRDHCLGGDIALRKGLIDNAVDHHEFDYRCIAAQSNVDIMNQQLIDAAKDFDVVFIGKGELIYKSTLSKIRKSGSHVCLWYGDVRLEPEQWLIDNLHECDTFFMTSAGKILELYYKMGKPGKAAFFLNPCIPELANKYANVTRSIDRPLFTGTQYSFMAVERQSTYEYLCKRGDVEIIGSPAKNFKIQLLRRIYLKFNPVIYLRGDEYITKIIRSRFGIGVSSFQDIKYYTSDRLTHFLTFGKLYLAYRFPGCDDLFEHEKHLVYFDNIRDLDKKINYYLAHKERAEEIGHSGQMKLHQEYNAANMTKMMLEIMSTGSSHVFPWVEIFS